MLRQLQIQNFALIEDQNIEFSNGLNAITGESGSGKSLLLDAISSIMGGKCNTMNIRTGCNKYVLQAVIDISKNPFVFQWLESKGFEAENGEIFIRKELMHDGRSRVQLNGAIIPQTLLKELGEILIEMHRQNDQVFLLDKNTQLQLLDEFAQVGDLKKEVGSSYLTYIALKKRIKEIESYNNEKKYKMDYLKYQIDEIKKANLQTDEEAELLNEESALIHHERLMENYSLMDDILSESESNVLSNIGKLLNSSIKVSKIDSNFEVFSQELDDIYNKLKQFHSFISNKKDKMDFSMDRLDFVQSRLDTIQKLKKKYGNSIQDILDYLTKIESELDILNTSEEQMASLNIELLNVAGQLAELCHKLSNARREAIYKFESSVQKELSLLGMKDAKLQVVMRWEASNDGDVLQDGKRYYVNENGLDCVEFYFTANQGEKPRPLRKVASGGELSRIMLALKSVIGTISDQVMVFDEIDSGIGGEIANHLAVKLKELSKKNQVILITHLQQIAAQSKIHIKVEKKNIDGRTFSKSKILDMAERTEELAKMISGDFVTRGAMEHARELLFQKAV